MRFSSISFPYLLKDHSHITQILTLQRSHAPVLQIFIQQRSPTDYVTLTTAERQSEPHSKPAFITAKANQASNRLVRHDGLFLQTDRRPAPKNIEFKLNIMLPAASVSQSPPPATFMGRAFRPATLVRPPCFGSCHQRVVGIHTYFENEISGLSFTFGAAVEFSLINLTNSFRNPIRLTLLHKTHSEGPLTLIWSWLRSEMFRAMIWNHFICRTARPIYPPSRPESPSSSLRKCSTQQLTEGFLQSRTPT